MVPYSFLSAYLELFAWLTVVQIFRYVLFAGGAHFLITHASATWLKRHQIQENLPLKNDLMREGFYSASTVLIYSAVYAFVFHPRIFPKTAVFSELSGRNLIWVVFSIPTLIVIHDTYFYWMHRFLHSPIVFANVHRIHHLSTNPSAISAQSFHPIEALLEVIWIVPVLFLLPLHLFVVIAFSFFSLTTNILGHSGVETVPASFAQSKIFSWLNTSTHHNGHHRYYRLNYSLYFRFWDRLMKTDR